MALTLEEISQQCGAHLMILSELQREILDEQDTLLPLLDALAPSHAVVIYAELTRKAIAMGRMTLAGVTSLPYPGEDSMEAFMLAANTQLLEFVRWEREAGLILDWLCGQVVELKAQQEAGA